MAIDIHIHTKKENKETHTHTNTHSHSRTPKTLQPCWRINVFINTSLLLAVCLYSEATERYSMLMLMHVHATCKGLGGLDEVNSLVFAPFSYTTIIS